MGTNETPHLPGPDQHAYTFWPILKTGLTYLFGVELSWLPTLLEVFRLAALDGVTYSTTLYRDEDALDFISLTEGKAAEVQIALLTTVAKIGLNDSTLAMVGFADDALLDCLPLGLGLLSGLISFARVALHGNRLLLSNSLKAVASLKAASP